MHLLVGAAILAALIGFAFGERSARLFVGFMLGMGAVLVLAIVTIAVIDIQRQSVVATRVIHMGPAR